MWLSFGLNNEFSLCQNENLENFEQFSLCWFRCIKIPQDSHGCKSIGIPQDLTCRPHNEPKIAVLDSKKKEKKEKVMKRNA